MTRSLTTAARLAAATLLTLLIAACGGAADDDTSHATAQEAQAQPGDATDGRKHVLAAAVNVEGPATTLTVRAHAVLAGNVGAMMQVLVDGTLIETVEVRATEPTDYRFTVPTIRPGSRVDLAYVNDGVVNGVDRNLWVAFLLAGNTHVLPATPAVTIDRGTGAAAFDGIDVSPGQAALWSNGAMRVLWPAPNMTTPITVRASGTLADGIGPIMGLRVDGVTVGSVEVRAATPTDYTFGILPLRPDSRVDIVYNNDAIVSGQDRNLQVAYAISGDTFVLADSAHASYDRGAGPAAFDGVNVSPGQGAMDSNGALRLRWPEPNLTDPMLVRAKGSLVGDVGPLMQVRVNGVIVATIEVRSVDWMDYSIMVPPLKAGDKIDLAFINDALVNGEDRNLHLAYAVSGTTFLLPTNAGVVVDRGKDASAFDGVDVIPGQGGLYGNGALRMVWPNPNITDVVTLRASASLAGGVGPIVQVRVDGVLVSSLEVRATTPTDHAVPVPALRPGSKIDLVYSNDGVIDGADRNVHVHYLLAGSTRVLPAMAGVVYDLGSGNAAFDGQDTQPGQTSLWSNGALRLTWPAPNITDSLVVRASATLAGNVGAIMQLRVDGVILGSVEVRSTQPTDYHFAVPALAASSKIDIVYTNDTTIAGQDRNLFIQYLKAGARTLIPNAPYAVLDSGVGESAFDGVGVSAGTGAIYNSSALRFTMPAAPAAELNQAARHAASRFLQQASFGPKTAEIDRLTTVPYTIWLAEQTAMPAAPNYVSYIQSKYDLGTDHRPGGSKFTSNWVGQRFWANAATGPDQLRKRMAFALHQIFMVSQADTNLHMHTRAYARYLDILEEHALGNFRHLLEEVALSPAMGIYLSHMRNRKEDPGTGRLPDENFAREVMQLFTIGLHELNGNGTLKLNTQGRPIETYNNADVMALAKVFTGWSWALPDDQLTEQNFRWGNPDYSVANDRRVDLLRMKAYPDQHSTSEKRLFSGKAHVVYIPPNTSAQDSLRIALDSLFRHPNVGPFISRQLIQRLVTSHPSNAYVWRVAMVFNNNGANVRGDLAAVVRAILNDVEARDPPQAGFGKLREPVLRVAHWMRSFDTSSRTGEYMMSHELATQAQRAMNAPSVFGYFRPGYVPPNTVFSDSSITVPEFQIVNESTTAYWVNMAMSMSENGLGSTGTTRDVSSSLAPQVALASAGNVDGLIQNINLMLFAGAMSGELQANLLDAVTGVSGNSADSHLNRARIALFLALSSPEYMVQR